MSLVSCFLYLRSMIKGTPVMYLALSLIPLQAFATSIPRGAQRVQLAQFSLTTACDDGAVIDTIVVQHEGLGAISDIERVYLMQGGRRVSRTVSLAQRDGTAAIRLNGLAIPSCATRTLTIAADFSSDATAGGEHRLSVSDVRLRSGSVTLEEGASAGSVSRLTPVRTGTITVEYRALLSSVRYGSSRTVARMLLSADDESDQSIVSMTLTNEGKARNGDLKNLRLYDGNILLAPVVAQLDGDVVRFELDPPLALGRNQSKLLTVKADVRAAVRKTIRLEVDEPSDIEAQ